MTANTPPTARKAAVDAQSGAAAGTADRWANGDASTTQAGARTLCPTTSSRKPPATGSAPTASTADGSHPTANAAAPTLNHAIGAAFAAPAMASPTVSGAPVAAAPI